MLAHTLMHSMHLTNIRYQYFWYYQGHILEDFPSLSFIFAHIQIWNLVSVSLVYALHFNSYAYYLHIGKVFSCVLCMK